MPKPRVPTRLKVIRGTFRKSEAPANEPEPTKIVDVPKPPSGLPAAGRKMWKRLASELVDKGLLTVLDLEALEAACTTWGIYIEAKKAIYRYWDPEPVLDKDGKMVRVGRWRKRTLAEYLAGRNSQTMPEHAVAKQALAEAKRWFAEFGLGAAARSRIDLPPEKDNETESAMEKLWNEG